MPTPWGHEFVNERVLSCGLLLTAFAACALAVDIPGDETTNRKLLARWQSDPERMERLRFNLAEFRDLPKDAQERVRRLDKELHDKDVSEASRLRGIMERYAGWVARLKEPDRAKLMEAPPGPARVRVVQELLERQWYDSLPKSDRDKLDKAAPEEKVAMLVELRKEDEDRRRHRERDRRAVEEAAALGPMSGGERITSFVEDSLKPLLTEADAKRLVQPTNRQGWIKYFELIGELSKPIDPLPFPGPAPPGKQKAVRSWADLPSDLEQKFPKPMPSEITAATGKWPDFAQAVAKVAKQNSIELPGRLLGPTKRDELPPSVRRIMNDLSGRLTDDEEKQLRVAEGHWPDYPKKIKELADKHKLTVPGLTRPTPRETPGGKNKTTKGPST